MTTAPERPAAQPLLAGLERHGDRWTLEMTRLVANFGGHLYGGAALAASVEIAAAETGWPVRWASTRFLVAPTIGERLSFTCELAAEGRRTAHATVRASTERGLAFETMVVAGSGDQRDEAVAGQWVSPPPVPAPEECEAVLLPEQHAGFAFGRIERRPAYGFDCEPGDPDDPDPGHRSAWVRLDTGDTGTPAALAWVADCVAMGLGRAFGQLSRATSLDNTIRYVEPTTSEWVLVDVRATAASGGYAYGVVHIFDPDGTLLGTGSQTSLIRLD
jgi:acyl-CoA thioesterase